jgi:OOP family OmpA-OmpF porin
MALKSNAFQNALHQEYVDLALAEKKENDGDAAFYFIEKAKLAATGESVDPQPLEERLLTENNKGELAKARLQLVDNLWNGSTEVTPAAARAQAMFNCWMQEQEENHQPIDITTCKTEFQKVYALLGTPPSKKEAPLPIPCVFFIR